MLHHNHLYVVIVCPQALLLKPAQLHVKYYLMAVVLLRYFRRFVHESGYGELDTGAAGISRGSGRRTSGGVAATATAVQADGQDRCAATRSAASADLP